MMKVAVVKGKGKAFEAACNNWFLEHKKAEIHKVSFALIDNTIPVAFILYNEQECGKRTVFADDESLASSPGSWLEYLIQAQQKHGKTELCEEEKEEASDGSVEDDEWPW